MKLLVTGGCGFVGSNLTQRLLDDGHEVVVVDAQWFGNFLVDHENLTVIREDVRNAEAIPLEGVEAILHLANVANDPCSDLNPKLSWEVNVLATMQLVERAIACGVKQFIYASSGSVYGSISIVGTPVRETQTLNFFNNRGIKKVYGSYQARPVSEPSVIATWNAKLDAEGIESQFLIAIS